MAGQHMYVDITSSCNKVQQFCIFIFIYLYKYNIVIVAWVTWGFRKSVFILGHFLRFVRFVKLCTKSALFHIYEV